MRINHRSSGSKSTSSFTGRLHLSDAVRTPLVVDSEGVDAAQRGHIRAEFGRACRIVQRDRHAIDAGSRTETSNAASPSTSMNTVPLM